MSSHPESPPDGSCCDCEHMTANPERRSMFKWCSKRKHPTAPAQRACRDIKRRDGHK